MTTGHDLVVGGSGMLAGLCEALAREDRIVSVIGRDQGRLQRLVQRHPNIRPLSVDYRDAEALERSLVAAETASGPIERAVCWIHTVAPDAPVIVGRRTKRALWHVLGSAAADPAEPGRLDRWRQRFSALSPLDYRIIVLGFVSGAEGSRWLTDAEISAGVKHALDTEAPLSIVGTVEPWSARP
ncbi:MAG: short-chain dehydrogenase [Proteobacteria bacterium]|nr:short-chain dehydrogenase [Pseudomonadota bacterium]MBI3497848.1 short-chain dehydrogenase [Pseudomonadota bacterium]